MLRVAIDMSAPQLSEIEVPRVVQSESPHPDPLLRTCLLGSGMPNLHRPHGIGVVRASRSNPAVEYATRRTSPTRFSPSQLSLPSAFISRPCSSAPSPIPSAAVCGADWLGKVNKLTL